MTKDHNFSADQDTQPIDSLPSSPSDSGDEKDSWIGNRGDEPFQDDAWINDEYMETQVIIDNDDEFLLCRETQAVDLGFGTQEEPFVDDDQLLQGFDGLATQVLDRSDDDVTVYLVDNSEVSDCGGDSNIGVGGGGNLLTSEDKSSGEHADENMKPMGALDSLSSGHENVKPTGKVTRFASVRSAAFRASAVAAQTILNGDTSTLASSSSGQGATNSSLLQQNFGDVGNQKSVEKKIEGKRTARKLLFEDDSPEENYPSPAGLSYIDSQEPGEASQASALKFVDKLISESGLNFDVETEAEAGYGRRTQVTLNKIPSVKGPQELAKKASFKARAVGNCMFDWDDNREDEGGGDIFLRRKEELLGFASKPSSLPRQLLHESHRRLEVSMDKRKVHSDSRLLQSSVTRSQKMNQAAKKNLGKELDAVYVEGNNKTSDMRDLVALGYDTKVAAEAVDAVCSGKVNGAASYLTGNKLSSPGEDRGVVTRQSRGTKRIQAMGKEELLRRRMNKASPSPAKAYRKSTERSSKSDQLDKKAPCCLKSRKVHTPSRETKKNLVDELDEVSKESNTRMFDRREEVEAGPDTQMAAEVISALHSGDARDEGKKSSRGVVTRKSKRLKGMQAVDDGDVESLKPKTKKAKSVTTTKACEKNMDEAVVSSTEERGRELSNKRCTSKLVKQSSGGEAEVLSYPKRRRSARISQDQITEAERSSEPAFDTPAKAKEPSKNVSPICMGDEYHRLSSRTSNSTREFRSLTTQSVEPILETKSTRKRRELGSVRVLFSQHLDEDVTKHLKKILVKFDISEASSMTEATHFIADSFMRTRNMLEAIASGKPVVTTQWLESIDQVNIYVDEDPYILRDSKKEKEFGFNMGVSLARARQNPLLKGRRVFITPNTKPGLNTITTLVKAVHGQPVERVGRSVLSDDRVPENLLVLSCEEDRDISIPFLERGAEVYSSELVLNGIVTQKLEYERYRLFTDHVRRTRSTIWIRDGKGKFQRR